LRNFDSIFAFSKYTYLERLKISISYKDVKEVYDRGSIHRFLLKAILEGNDVRVIPYNNIFFSMCVVLSHTEDVAYKRDILDWLLFQASSDFSNSARLVHLDVYHYLLNTHFTAPMTVVVADEKKRQAYIAQLAATCQNPAFACDTLAVMASTLYSAHEAIILKHAAEVTSALQIDAYVSVDVAPPVVSCDGDLPYESVSDSCKPKFITPTRSDTSKFPFANLPANPSFRVGSGFDNIKPLPATGTTVGLQSYQIWLNNRAELNMKLIESTVLENMAYMIHYKYLELFYKVHEKIGLPRNVFDSVIAVLVQSRLLGRSNKYVFRIV